MLDIPAGLLTAGGPTGVLVFVVLLVLTGRLIPRAQHEDRVRDKDTQIANLAETVKVKDEQIRVRDEQVTKLLPNTDLTVRLLQGLAREAGRHDLAS